MPLRVGRRIRQLVSQTLRTQHLNSARHTSPPFKCPASTTAPGAAPPPPKFHRSLGQDSKPRAFPSSSSDSDALHQRITKLFSLPNNSETEKELVELRHTSLPSPELVCLLAQALVHHAYVPDALDLLSHSRKQGIAIPSRLYEPVVYRLAQRHRWTDILALLEPLQSLSPTTPTAQQESEKHKMTTRLCEWRVRACAELGDFAGMERALGMFPHGIPRRAWGIAERACIKNSDPNTAAKIQEVLRLAEVHKDKKRASKGREQGKGKEKERSGLDEIVQALVRSSDPRGPTSHEPSTTTRIERAPQTNEDTHPTYLITTYTTPSSSNNPPPSHSFTPHPRLATRCIHALVRGNRVTEAATMVASMCRGAPLPESAAPSSTAQSSSSEPPSLTLPEIFASVRPNILVFNALLKGILDTRGLGGMLPLLEIMRDVDVKPDSETAAILLRYLDRQGAWSPGRLIDTLVDLTSPIPEDHSNDPAVPPKSQPVPVSIRHTNVLLGSILHAERKSTLGGGWKASSAFLKYRTRPADRYPPSDARLTSSPHNIDPPTAGLRFKARAESLQPVLEALRARGVRNDSMAYALRAQRDGVVRLDPEAGRRVLQRAGIPLGEYHYAALMAGLVECGYMDAAGTVMKAAHEVGFGVDSPVMYTILVSGYGRMGLPQQAERVFDKMLAAGVKPDAIAVDALAGAWFISGSYHRAREVVMKHWPGEGELPFTEDSGLKLMITELRKLRPTFKVRQKRVGRTSKGEVECVGRIVEAIKAPDKALPLAVSAAAGEKKDAAGSTSRRFSSVAGVGLELGRTSKDQAQSDDLGERGTRGRTRTLSSILQNG